MDNPEKNAGKRPGFTSLLDQVSDWLGNISGLAIAAMVFLVAANVVSRKLFSWSMPGFYEVLGLIGAVFYSFGVVYAAIKGQHIIMDMLINRLPASMKKFIDGVTRVIVLIFCGLLCVAGYRVTVGILDERTDDLHIPVAPFRLIILVAFLLLALLILAGKNIGKRGEE